MKLTTLYFLLIVLIGIGTSVQAQKVEEEVPFLYMKAKYLYDTDRHEDAVNAFNKVVKADPSYEDALVLRAASKYGLAAYKGALNDLKESIDVKGVTPDAVSWMAFTYEKLGENVKAKNTLETALLADAKNAKLWTLKGDLAEADSNFDLACESWERASQLGDSMADRLLERKCNTTNKKTTKKRPSKPKFEQADPMTSTSPATTNDSDSKDTEVGYHENDEGDEVVTGDESESVEDEPIEESTVETKPEHDPNEKEIIVIDEDLTLVIYGEGLGSRRILDQPNILIMSDEDGEVAVNICVSSNGNVRTAEYNDELSTIKKQSLISVAIRKSKEFWFAKDIAKESCGVIIFQVKGN